MSRLIGIILCVIVLISCVYASREDDILEQKQSSNRFSSRASWISECRANNGLTGTCMTRSDCTNRGGSPSGECASTLGVCCTGTLGCGQSSRLKRVVLSNITGFQSPCFYSIFSTIYVPFSANSVIGLRFSLANRLMHPNLPIPNWRIRITQLECPLNPTRVQRNLDLDQTVEYVGESRLFSSPRPDIDDAFWVAPHGCLQYFPEPHGVFESFNFNNGNGSYIGNMRYPICFRRRLVDRELRLTAQTFILPRTPILPGPNEGFDFACYSPVATPTRHEDYLFISEGSLTVQPMIRASRFCGQGIQGTTVIASQPGPFAVHFNADDHYEPPIGAVGNPDHLEIGFRFTYKIV